MNYLLHFHNCLILELGTDQKYWKTFFHLKGDSLGWLEPQQCRHGLNATYLPPGGQFLDLNFEKKNIVVIGMSADSSKKQKKFCDKQKFQYPMLSDEGKDVLKGYGVWGQKKFMGREYDGIFRNTYVIDEKGLIEKAYKKVNVKTHAQDILAEL